MRKLIWTGIILGLIPLYMGVACGGYIGWPGLSTSGADAKVTEELSVSSTNPLESGLFTYYVQYNNIGQQNMKTVSTFRDGTAPFGVFTSDGNAQQHFSDHVGVLIASANDRNGDGVICWKSSPGSKYSNSLGNGSNFSPTVLGQILATSQLNSSTGALTVTVNGLSLPSGASHTLTTPISFNLFGYYHGIAINANQAGLVEAANWLASQWAGQPDGGMNVTVSLNGGAASTYLTIASGNSASIVMQNFAATH